MAALPIAHGPARALPSATRSHCIFTLLKSLKDARHDVCERAPTLSDGAHRQEAFRPVALRVASTL